MLYTMSCSQGFRKNDIGILLLIVWIANDKSYIIIFLWLLDVNLRMDSQKTCVYKILDYNMHYVH